MSAAQAPTAQVFLRPLGSPLTLSMSGLAIASLVQGGVDLHWLAPTQGHVVGLILVSVPFVLQIVACVLAYLARDGATGAAVGVLATSWLGLGLVHLSSAPGSRSGGLGLMLIAAGAVLILSSAAVTISKPLPGLVFVLAGVRFALSGIHELGAAGGWANAAGVLSLIVLGLSCYCVLAFELEGIEHAAILPTFRRGPGRTVLTGGAAQQVGNAAGEPGVRRTT